MPFIILGENLSGDQGSTGYRGTFRERPPHWDSLPEDAEYNRLFSWYCEEGGESLVVQDLDRARRLMHLLRDELRQGQFEIVEATRIGVTPSVGGEFLGCDVSSGWTASLLSGGLNFAHPEEPSEKRKAVEVLLELAHAHFEPLLNEHGLFSDEGTADFCLRSMLALGVLSPGLWQGPEWSGFEVVSIYRVLGRIS